MGIEGVECRGASGFDWNHKSRGEFRDVDNLALLAV